MPTRKKPVRRRNTPKKTSAFTRKSRFIMPWPYIVFIFLCVGVLLAGWTFQAAADDISVRAKVSAPLPSGPAVITSPGDGTHFTDVPITVAGTCPTDTYIKLYRNDFFSGTAICTTDGNFQLQTDLFPGANQLKARVFNLTDDEGPQPSVVTVYYDVPQPPSSEGNGSSSGGSSTSSSNSSGNPITAPFEISTDFAYKGYKVGQNIQWNVNVSGGTPPYALNVDWGDGHNDVISQKDAGNVTLEHRYKSTGSHTKSSFIIKIMGTDSAGHQAFLQLFLSVGPAGIPNIVASNLPKGPHLNKNWLLVAWPAYLVLALMITSFWLGEKEEIIKIRRSSWRGRRV
jgi:hypothetical protein